MNRITMNHYEWSELNELAYNATREPDELLGKIHCGTICFDVLVRDYDGRLAISYDCYIAYRDTGYGYTPSGIPYDYCDGTDLFDTSLQYDDFVKTSEALLDEFIHERKLESEAEKPLLIW